MASTKHEESTYALITTQNQDSRLLGKISAVFTGINGLAEAAQLCKIEYQRLKSNNRRCNEFPTVWRIVLPIAAIPGRDVPWLADWCAELDEDEYEFWREICFGKRQQFGPGHPQWAKWWSGHKWNRTSANFNPPKHWKNQKGVK
jgi:hypothetical protein